MIYASKKSGRSGSPGRDGDTINKAEIIFFGIAYNDFLKKILFIVKRGFVFEGRQEARLV